MSKELLRPELFCKVNKIIVDEDLKISPEQALELSALYEATVAQLKTGQLITGKVVKAGSGGVVVDISYKSDGVIPRYEFTDHELQSLKPGDDIEVPTLNGKVRLKIPVGTQADKIFRLKGKGIPELNGYGRGDQLVKISLYTPEKIDKEEKKLIEKLADFETKHLHNVQKNHAKKKKGFFRQFV